MLTFVYLFLMTGILLVSSSMLPALEYHVVNYSYLHLYFTLKAHCSVSCTCCPALWTVLLCVLTSSVG